MGLQASATVQWHSFGKGVLIPIRLICRDKWLGQWQAPLEYKGFIDILQKHQGLVMRINLIIARCNEGVIEMVSAGLLLKGNLVRIVTLSGTRQSHKLVALKVNKLELGADPDQDAVEAFSHAFRAFCADHAVEGVVVNRRTTTGQGAGGSATFRTEGILLSMCPCPIQFVHHTTVRATDRKQANLKSARPATADLSKAYDLAFEGLP